MKSSCSPMAEATPGPSRRCTSATAALFRFMLGARNSAGHRSTAEEVFQEAWIRVIERAAAIPRRRGSPPGSTIAHNLLVDHWRKKGLLSRPARGRCAARRSRQPRKAGGGARKPGALVASDRCPACRAAGGIPASPGSRPDGRGDRGGHRRGRRGGEEPPALRDGQAEVCGER